MAIEHPQQPLGIASPAESVGTDVLSLMAAPQGSFGDNHPPTPPPPRFNKAEAKRTVDGGEDWGDGVTWHGRGASTINRRRLLPRAPAMGAAEVCWRFGKTERSLRQTLDARQAAWPRTALSGGAGRVLC